MNRFLALLGVRGPVAGEAYYLQVLDIIIQRPRDPSLVHDWKECKLWIRRMTERKMAGASWCACAETEYGVRVMFSPRTPRLAYPTFDFCNVLRRSWSQSCPTLFADVMPFYVLRTEVVIVEDTDKPQSWTPKRTLDFGAVSDPKPNQVLVESQERLNLVPADSQAELKKIKVDVSLSKGKVSWLEWRPGTRVDPSEYGRGTPNARDAAIIGEASKPLPLLVRAVIMGVVASAAALTLVLLPREGFAGVPFAYHFIAFTGLIAALMYYVLEPSRRFGRLTRTMVGMLAVGNSPPLLHLAFANGNVPAEFAWLSTHPPWHFNATVLVVTLYAMWQDSRYRPPPPN